MSMSAYFAALDRQTALITTYTAAVEAALRDADYPAADKRYGAIRDLTKDVLEFCLRRHEARVEFNSLGLADS